MLSLAERRSKISGQLIFLWACIYITEKNKIRYKVRIILKNSIFLIDFDEIKTENYSSLTYMFSCLYAIDVRFSNLNSR